MRSRFETLAAGFRTRPAFLALWYGGLRSARVREGTRSTRTAIGSSVQRILADSQGDPEVLAESTAMLRAYLAARLARA
jgi:hypothetical protein